MNLTPFPGKENRAKEDRPAEKGTIETSDLPESRL